MDSVDDSLVLIHEITGKILFTLPVDNEFINGDNANLLSLVSAEEQQKALDYFLKSKQEGICNYNLHLINKQSIYGEFEIQSQFFLNGQQQLIHSRIQPKAVNIVEKQEVAGLRFKPNKEIKFLFENTSIPTILSKKDGRLLYFNEPALQLLGINPQNANNLFAQDFYFDANQRPNFIKKLEQHRTIENRELKLTDNKGKFFWVLLTSKLIEYEGEELLLNHLMDISYQKQIELKHEVAAQRLDLATNAAKVGVWEYDLLTNEVYWSKSMFDIVGKKEEDAENKLRSFVKYSSEIQRKNFLKFLSDEKNETLVLKNSIKRKNENVHFQTTCRKYHNRHGDLTKVLGITIDITELQYSKIQLFENLKDEAIVAKIIAKLNSLNEIGESVKQVLAILGQYLSVDCISLHYLVKSQESLYFDWCRNKQVFHIKKHLEVLPELDSRIICEDEKSLPAELKIIFKKVRDHSFCIFPLMLRDEQIGLITFCNSEDKKWTNSQLEWIENIVKFIAHAFEKEEHNREIRRQQQLLRNITNNISDVITQTDVDGIITYASPGWLKVTGFHPEEVLGKSSFNFIHPDDLDFVLEEFRNLKTQQTNPAIFRFLHKSGTYQWCEIRSSLIKNKDNLIEGIITGGYVVEERINAEKALINSELKYRTLFEKAPIGVLLIDNEGKIREINKVLQQTFNIAAIGDIKTENIFHKSWLKKSAIFNQIKECFVSNNTTTGEATYKKENGELVIFKYYLNPVLIDEELAQVHAVMVDITNQKAVEEELKNNQLRMQQITTNITDLITEVNDEGIIIYASPSWKFMLGYNPNKIIGKHIYTLIPSHSKETLLEIIKKRFGNKHKRTFQHQVIDKRGKVLWFESSGQYLHDDEDNVIGAIFGSSDITERKEAEHLLINQNIELKKATEELDSFVYRSSHDLKAPLTSVLGLINISKYSEDIAERNNFLLLMEQTIHKLDGVIKQITTYSRNSRLTLQKDKINFEDLQKKLIEEFSYIDELSSIDLDFRINSPVEFYCDEHRTYTIIKNILANAILYRNWNQENNWVMISIEVNHQQAIIKISDNGTGIPQEEHGKIFNMFHRSSNISKGAGLGLYIVKETLQRLNGSISFESVLGKGSTFKVSLPQL